MQTRSSESQGFFDRFSFWGSYESKMKDISQSVNYIVTTSEGKVKQYTVYQILINPLRKIFEERIQKSIQKEGGDVEQAKIQGKIYRYEKLLDKGLKKVKEFESSQGIKPQDLKKFQRAAKDIGEVALRIENLLKQMNKNTQEMLDNKLLERQLAVAAKIEEAKALSNYSQDLSAISNLMKNEPEINAFNILLLQEKTKLVPKATYDLAKNEFSIFKKKLENLRHDLNNIHQDNLNVQETIKNIDELNKPLESLKSLFLKELKLPKERISYSKLSELANFRLPSNSIMREFLKDFAEIEKGFDDWMSKIQSYTWENLMKAEAEIKESTAYEIENRFPLSSETASLEKKIESNKEVKSALKYFMQNETLLKQYGNFIKSYNEYRLVSEEIKNRYGASSQTGNEKLFKELAILFADFRSFSEDYKLVKNEIENYVKGKNEIHNKTMNGVRDKLHLDLLERVEKWELDGLIKKNTLENFKLNPSFHSYSELFNEVHSNNILLLKQKQNELSKGKEYLKNLQESQTILQERLEEMEKQQNNNHQEMERIKKQIEQNSKKRISNENTTKQLNTSIGNITNLKEQIDSTKIIMQEKSNIIADTREKNKSLELITNNILALVRQEEKEYETLGKRQNEWEYDVENGKEKAENYFLTNEEERYLNNWAEKSLT